MYYLFLADGFEDVEAFAPLDLIRRGKADLKTVGVTSKSVISARGVKVEADLTEIDFDNFEGVILPGGAGYKILRESKKVGKALRFAVDNDKLIAAICASPTILSEKSILKGKRATCYPSLDLREILESGDIIPDYDKDTVVDGNIITSRSAGTSFSFGLAILEFIVGKQKSDIVYNNFYAK